MNICISTSTNECILSVLSIGLVWDSALRSKINKHNIILLICDGTLDYQSFIVISHQSSHLFSIFSLQSNQSRAIWKKKKTIINSWNSILLLSVPNSVRDKIADLWILIEYHCIWEYNICLYAYNMHIILYNIRNEGVIFEE